MRWPTGCGLAFALLLGVQGGEATALPLEPNTRFTLGNHPAGSAAEPFYGLRIDALAGCGGDRHGDCDDHSHGDWKDDDRDDDWDDDGDGKDEDWKHEDRKHGERKHHGDDDDDDDDGDRHGDRDHDGDSHGDKDRDHGDKDHDHGDKDRDDDDHGDKDRDRDLGVFVFDFGFCDPLAQPCEVSSEAVANGAAMFMDYLPDGSLHIHGNAWGGLVKDHEFEDALLWAIDFRYTALAFDPDADIQFAEEGSGSGTLTALQTRGGFSAGQVIPLADEGGKHDISFALAFGTRGFDGLSGYGRLEPEDLEDCDEAGKHGQKAEWLFTASNPVPVPEPGTLALAALGLLGLALRGRRRLPRA